MKKQHVLWAFLGCAFWIAGCDIVFLDCTDLVRGCNLGPRVDAGAREAAVGTPVGELDANTTETTVIEAQSVVGWLGPVSMPVVDAGTSLDATTSLDTPDAGTSLDATAVSDARASLDARTDTGARDSARDVPAVDAPSHAVVLELSPHSCSGYRIATTNDFVGYARAGMAVWHICYQTPSRATSSHPQATTRAQRIYVDRFDRVARRLVREAHIDAPTTANPWVANYLIALPAAQASMFNIESLLSEDTYIRAVQENTRGGFPELNGRLDVWRVQTDGTEIHTRPAMYCRDNTTRGAFPMLGFFVPEQACLHDDSNCDLADIDLYDCQAPD